MANNNTSQEEGNKIYPRRLDITWGDDPSYWKLDKTSEIGPAELKRVCWLQVTGTKDVDRGKLYEIKFNISLNEDAFGWNGLPLYLIAKAGEGRKYSWQRINPLKRTTTDIPTPEEKKFIVKIPDGQGTAELFFGLYEIWSNKWKGGLRINYATVEEARQPN